VSGAGNFGVFDAAGDLVDTFSSVGDALAGAAAVADTYVASLEDQITAYQRTALEQARYDANLDRVRFATVLATQQVANLVDSITGDFEPVLRGPFETALDEGQARIDALSDHLSAVNDEISAANQAFPELEATLIDVTATITDAQADLLSNLQSDFQDSLTAQIRDAEGNGFLNTIQDILDTRAAVAIEADALGLDPNQTAGSLFWAQLNPTLADLDENQLDLVLAAFSDDALVDGVNGFLEALQSSSSDLTLSAEAVTAGTGAFTSTLTSQLSDLEVGIERVSSSALSLRQSASSLLTDRTLSPLSARGQLLEARTQLEAAYALVNDGTPDDAESLDALSRLAGLNRTTLELSRNYFASSEGYLEDWTRGQEILNTTAANQEILERTMVARLTEIRDLLGDNDNSPNPGTSFTRLPNGQYVSDTGFDLGARPEVNLSILNGLLAAGLPIPTGFGEGQLGPLRQQNALVDEFISGLGFATAGQFEIRGPSGVDNLIAPVRLSVGEVVNVSRGDHLAGLLQGMSQMVRAIDTMRVELAELQMRNVQATAHGSLRVAGAVDQNTAIARRTASAQERASVAPAKIGKTA
jgi:hypothetical protein